MNFKELSARQRALRGKGGKSQKLTIAVLYLFEKLENHLNPLFASTLLFEANESSPSPSITKYYQRNQNLKSSFMKTLTAIYQMLKVIYNPNLSS